ncbi:MAG: hypothetical protein K0S63_595, partial [Gammaproteobacteria bacterium]|nr:hypothetical protein [Gammaproteobacteria bacterium]
MPQPNCPRCHQAIDDGGHQCSSVNPQRLRDDEILKKFYIANMGALSAQMAIEAGIDCCVNESTLEGIPLLYQAVKNQDLKVTRLLLKRGADPNCVTAAGRTPLYEAVCQGNLLMVQWLLEKGVNPNCSTLNGKMPLYRAVCMQKEDIVEALLKKGAKTYLAAYNQKENVFETPVVRAGKNKSRGILLFLLKYRAPLEEVYFDNFLDSCCQYYRQSVNDDKNYLNYVISCLTGVNILELLNDPKNGEKYFFYLDADKKLGVKKKESWHEIKFLPLNIRVFLEIWLNLNLLNLRIPAQNNPQKKSVESLCDFLRQELICNIEALAITQCIVSSRLFFKKNDERDVDVACDALAGKIANHLIDLPVGSEYSLPTGWNTHVVYVSFIRDFNSIIIRVDNLGNKADQDFPRDDKLGPGQPFHPIDKRYLQIPVEERQLPPSRHPCLLGRVSLDLLKSEFVSLYLRPIIKVAVEGMPAEKAYPKLYSRDMQGIEFVEPERFHLPSDTEQLIGNCVVKGYKLGLKFRLNDDAVYEWLCAEEKRIVSALFKKEKGWFGFSFLAKNKALNEWADSAIDVLDYKKFHDEFLKQRNDETERQRSREKKLLQSQNPDIRNRQANEEEKKAVAVPRQLRLYVEPMLIQLISPSVEPEAKSATPEVLRKGLFDVMENFLYTSTQRLMLLQGNSGSGKSSALLYIKEIEKTREWQVLHIKLAGRLKRSVANNIADILIQSDPQENFLLLLDGYDEMNDSSVGNLYQWDQFIKSPRLKVIITCRSQALQSQNYQDDFIPADVKGVRQNHLFCEYNLLPFETDQINAYLNKCIPHDLHPNDRARKLRWYQHHIDSISGLAEVAKTPLLLRIVVDALPLLIQEQNTREQKEDRTPFFLTRAILYDAFMRQWFVNQSRRLLGNPELKQLANPMEAFMAFSKRLALAMAAENTVGIFYQADLPEHKIWAQFFDNPAPEIKLALQGCPLKKEGGYYSFIHKSFLEYFTARGIWDALKLPLNQTEQVKETGIKTRFILNEVAVIEFLHEMSRQEPEQREKLFAWITQTRGDNLPPGTKRAGACAATVLNALHQGFAQHDPAGQGLQGIRILKADLRGAHLQGVNLRNADLSRTKLDAANLSQAKLQGARLHGLILGQRPFIQMEDTVHCIAYHPRLSLMALGVGKNIILWDNANNRVCATLEG